MMKILADLQKALALFVVISLSYLVYSCTPSTREWNRKITIAVETPRGIVTSSTVQYERAQFGAHGPFGILKGLIPNGVISFGEAAFVDLGKENIFLRP